MKTCWIRLDKKKILRLFWQWCLIESQSCECKIFTYHWLKCVGFGNSIYATFFHDKNLSSLIFSINETLLSCFVQNNCCCSRNPIRLTMMTHKVERGGKSFISAQYNKPFRQHHHKVFSSLTRNKHRSWKNKKRNETRGWKITAAVITTTAISTTTEPKSDDGAESERERKIIKIYHALFSTLSQTWADLWEKGCVRDGMNYWRGKFIGF